tara:strand:+ start:961 stop:3486 length:2526 start_codon:yes stop_codon:yes gene_type:complete
MVRRGSFIGGQDNLSVPDAPTIGVATAGEGQVSVAFTAPSAVGDDPITNFGISVFPATGTTRTFRVTVAYGNLYGGGAGNIYYIDGIANPALTLIKGFTYVFDQSDSSNSGHPLRFKDGSGNSYSTGVTVAGTQGSSGASVTLVLAEDATEPSQYYCTVHGNGMGNLITLVAPSASDDPLGQAQYSNTGSSSPITVTGLTNDISYVAKAWAINDYGNGPLSAATSSFTPEILPNGLFAGGTSGSNFDVVDQIKPDSAGNATDFGDLLTTRRKASGGGSDTRFIVAGGIGYSGSNDNVIQYMTYATSGNAIDFGDLANSTNSSQGSSISNNVRYIHTFGVTSGTSGEINYFTIASTGNATDFGDQTGTFYLSNIGNISSTTRGIIGGSGNSTYNQTIHYVTIASTGNTTDFGDLTNSSLGYGGRFALVGMSSSTRGLFAGGKYSTPYQNIIDYITIASTGNATDFGDLTVARGYMAGLSSSTRGVVGGGNISGDTYQNVIDFVTIASTGDATDFGDLSVARAELVAGGAGHAAVQNEAGFPPAAIGLFGAGYGTSSGNNVRYKSAITYIDIASTGNNIMFGDLSVGRDFIYNGTAASTTRGLFAGGYTGSNSDVIDFSTFSTKGKATDFGNLTTAAYTGGISSNSTRAISSGGYTSSTINVIEYVTIASAGNATDFGDLNSARQYTTSAASTTRSVIAGGDPDNNFNNPLNVIEYVTIASTSNATDFGDLTVARYGLAGLSSNTRAVFGGGTSSSAMSTNFLDYITIASTANAQDFGDLTKNHQKAASVSSGTRGVFAGAVADDFTMQYITIASTGDGTDFGDLTNEHYSGSGASNSHGGLS